MDGKRKKEKGKSKAERALSDRGADCPNVVLH